MGNTWICKTSKKFAAAASTFTSISRGPGSGIFVVVAVRFCVSPGTQENTRNFLCWKLSTRRLMVPNTHFPATKVLQPTAETSRNKLLGKRGFWKICEIIFSTVPRHDPTLLAIAGRFSGRPPLSSFFVCYIPSPLEYWTSFWNVLSVNVL